MKHPPMDSSHRMKQCGLALLLSLSSLTAAA